MTYAESARNGQPIAATQHAILTGSLWAIAISWSTAIRSVVIELIPENTRDVVLGELLAAAITTAFAVGISLVVSRRWCARDEMKEPPHVRRRTRSREQVRSRTQARSL